MYCSKLLHIEGSNFCDPLMILRPIDVICIVKKKDKKKKNRKQIITKEFHNSEPTLKYC